MIKKKKSVSNGNEFKIFKLASERKLVMSKNIKIYISGYGGEHTCGYIDTNIAQYWLENQSSEEFIRCLFDSDKFDDTADEWKHIPKEFMLPENYYDVTQVLHMDAPEFSSENQIDVWSADPPEGTSGFIAEFKLSKDISCYEEDPQTGEIPENKTRVYTQVFCKGSWMTEEFMITGDFDKSKLEINTVCWNDLKLIQSLKYDGELIEIGLEHGEPQEEHAWID